MKKKSDILSFSYRQGHFFHVSARPLFFYICLTDCSIAMVPRRKDVSHINTEQKRKQRILIADDSEMNRSILADMLGDEYDILEAENGVEAVAALQK